MYFYFFSETDLKINDNIKANSKMLTAGSEIKAHPKPKRFSQQNDQD
jgi:hypothetical protein